MLKMYPFCHWRYLSLDGDRPMRMASSMYTQRIQSRLFAVADANGKNFHLNGVGDIDSAT